MRHQSGGCSLSCCWRRCRGCSCWRNKWKIVAVVGHNCCFLPTADFFRSPNLQSAATRPDQSGSSSGARCVKQSGITWDQTKPGQSTCRARLVSSNFLLSLSLSFDGHVWPTLIAWSSFGVILMEKSAKVSNKTAPKSSFCIQHTNNNNNQRFSPSGKWKQRLCFVFRGRNLECLICAPQQALTCGIFIAGSNRRDLSNESGR